MKKKIILKLQSFSSSSISPHEFQSSEEKYKRNVIQQFPAKVFHSLFLHGNVCDWNKSNGSEVWPLVTSNSGQILKIKQGTKMGFIQLVLYLHI